MVITIAEPKRSGLWIYHTFQLLVAGLKIYGIGMPSVRQLPPRIIYYHTLVSGDFIPVLAL